MKLYSTAEKRLSTQEEADCKPAPYNWLAMLVIFILYVVLALLV